MTSTHRFENKVIWSLDPFEEELSSKGHLLSTLAQISKEQNCAIEPVYVLNLAAGITQPVQYKHAAEKAIHAVIQDLKDIELLPPRVLLAEDASSSEMAKILASYAEATHARLILVGTHARQGLQRLVLGSFAETLIPLSPVPTLTVGPNCNTTQGTLNQLLFVTNLEDHADEIYPKIRAFAKSLGLQITVFYAVPPRIEPVLQTMTYLVSGGWVLAPEYLLDEESNKRKKAEAWALDAQEKGAVLNIHFEVAPGNIAELVMDYTKAKKIGWIGLASESSALKSATVGSIARQIVRSAPCPVWISRPRHEKPAHPDGPQVQKKSPIEFLTAKLKQDASPC